MDELAKRGERPFGAWPMTRARLIEKVIAEWFDRSTEFTPDGEDGMMFIRLMSAGEISMDVPGLAAAIDAEFDRIIRETPA